MADDKSILLIAHPACYTSHKKHEQLEKPWGDVKSYSWSLNRNRNIFQALVSLMVPTQAWKQLPTGRSPRMRWELASPWELRPPPPPHLSPWGDGRHLVHPHVFCWEPTGWMQRIGRVWVLAVRSIFAFFRWFQCFFHSPPISPSHLPRILREWFPNIICQGYICKAIVKFHAGPDKMPPPHLRKKRKEN